MEQQVEIQKQRRKRTKVAPEDREKHKKEYMKEYYQENFKPYTNNCKKGRPKKEYTTEELDKKKEKLADYRKQYYQKIKQLKELSEKKD
jgi:hypothetical protein